MPIPRPDTYKVRIFVLELCEVENNPQDPISGDFSENIHALTNGRRKQINQTQNGNETKGDRAKKLKKTYINRSL